MIHHFPRPIVLAAAMALVVLGASACRQRNPEESIRTVRVWCHQGQEAENKAMREIAAAFNLAHTDRNVRVSLNFFPDFQYNEKIAIAAAAHDLPDALDLDGPLVARYVDANLLAPLNSWFDRSELEDFLPTVREQGTINGRLYALGAFESAVVLYYDRALFDVAGVSPPPAERAWTWDEFLAACGRLRAAGIEPVAMHMDESADEWFTYAFSPIIWSGRGKLVSANGRRVRGVLASDANVASLKTWQEVFRRHFAATDPVDPDPFDHDRVAMDWSGHWLARAHVARKGANLGAMPLPRFGPEPVAPCGSWCWGISARARDPELAALWVKWVTDLRHGVEPIVRANGAVPARRSAFALFPEYSRMPYKLFRDELEQFARPRPRTPFYSTLTQRFAAALRDIARGAEVEPRLKTAENEIQTVIDRRTSTHAGAAE